MIAAAIERAKEAGAANAEFACADAQTHVPGVEPSDVVISRFGVMFFDDPTAAFANIGRSTRPGGRLAFICWQAASENPWLAETNAVVERHIGPMPAAAPGAPGPLALADPDRVRTILRDAGWVDVDIADHRAPLYQGGPGSPEEIADFWMARPSVAAPVAAGPPELATRVRASLVDLFAPLHDGTGVRFDSAVWLVQARRGQPSS
jgi:SAM-dependent methyltransferase